MSDPDDSKSCAAFAAPSRTAYTKTTTCKYTCNLYVKYEVHAYTQCTVY